MSSTALGTQHPTARFEYRLNYGFVPGYVSADGEELDAYVVGPEAAIEDYEGHVVAVILRGDDIEDKLVVSQRTWTRSELADLVHFQERFFQSTVVTAT